MEFLLLQISDFIIYITNYLDNYQFYDKYLNCKKLLKIIWNIWKNIIYIIFFYIFKVQ